MTTNIAKAFCIIRAACGLQQAELASRIGISRRHLCLIESGKRNPSQRVITNLGDAFGVPTAVIMEFAEEDITDVAVVLLRWFVSASGQKQRAVLSDGGEPIFSSQRTIVGSPSADDAVSYNWSVPIIVGMG